MMKVLILVFCAIVLFTSGVSSQEIFPAVMRGDLDRVKALLEEHPEWINATSWGEWTPLHRASQFGHGDIVELLISKGGDLDSRTGLGLTPLYAAIIGERPAIVRQLIDHGADIRASRSDGETLLHIAAAMGQANILEMLISEGLEVDVTKRYGITPLHLASVFGHKTAVETLLARGAEIDRKNDNGSTALHLATSSREMEVAALLEEKGASDEPEGYIEITGEYLGQKEPGSRPEPFASGILLNMHRPHGSIAFSPDGKEIYWTAALIFGQFQKIWTTRRHDGRWSAPEAVSLPDGYTYGGPAVSPDGKRLLFDAMRSAQADAGGRDHDIWFREMGQGGWSDVIRPGTPLNSDRSELGPSVSLSGDLYFYSYNIEGGFGSIDIYCSKLTKDGYQKPENLGGSINTDQAETLPFIAPDESYLLFSSMRPGGYGDFDLYVSYRRNDGTWSKARNLGDTINTPARESVSVVSPDGKYLFFMSRRSGIGEFYWVDAGIIEDLRPDELE
ncbi:MAG TPA: ankyrin repeat domain-containing protein [Candidatus Krumholzibacterium sp.]|nr:ankyrin repeat domain-containing protein [Candidatus Krumholzibacterium sp.]